MALGSAELIEDEDTSAPYLDHRVVGHVDGLDELLPAFARRVLRPFRDIVLRVFDEIGHPALDCLDIAGDRLADDEAIGAYSHRRLHVLDARAVAADIDAELVPVLPEEAPDLVLIDQELTEVDG